MVLVIILVVAVIGIACLLQGVLVTNRFEVVHEKININNLPKEFSGKKILHISDLHNSRFGEKNAELAKTVKELSPDYIFVSGDCIDRFSKNGNAFIELLGNLGGQFLVYYSLGNHDVVVRRDNPKEYAEFFSKIRELGVTVLDNAYVPLEEGSAKIHLFGVSSIREKKGEATVLTPELIEEKIGKCPNDAPTFLLAHEGHLFESYAEWGADITFSGHIHGGIIRLPILGGVFGEYGRLFPKYTKGVYELNGKYMNLSSGLGYTKFKFRFLNTPEISLITLE
ncbi:MAG: metallophosphoesterase [Clostridia bacterium]|nr:metallophosphoesterase [Clostridia bacterium]